MKEDLTASKNKLKIIEQEFPRIRNELKRNIAEVSSDITKLKNEHEELLK